METLEKALFVLLLLVATVAITGLVLVVQQQFFTLFMGG